MWPSPSRCRSVLSAAFGPCSRPTRLRRCGLASIAARTRDCWKRATSSAGPGSVVFAQAFLAQGWQLRQTLVWVKDRLVLGHSDYHYRHEPILYGVRPGAAGRQGRGGRGWHGDNTASSVFEVPAPHRNAGHPTSKPVALIEPMLRNSSRTGEVVLDP